MNDQRKLFIDNIGSIVITPASIRRLQSNQPIVRKRNIRQIASTSEDSEVVSLIVHPGIWELAQEKADLFATRIVVGRQNIPKSELSEETLGKIRATMQKLIVIESPTSVTVYDSIRNAKSARQAQAAHAKHANPLTAAN